MHSAGTDKCGSLWDLVDQRGQMIARNWSFIVPVTGVIPAERRDLREVICR